LTIGAFLQGLRWRIAMKRNGFVLPFEQPLRKAVRGKKQRNCEAKQQQQIGAFRRCGSRGGLLV
jgi:hypothetical protein